ncbi:MAG: response regulator transcription factor [Planctomycetes bacterium]|nr:response regulator transcription factor [Planctomycetota bacterium]
MAQGNIRVFLADDHAMVREGLAAFLAKDLAIAIVGQCGDGLKIVEEAAKVQPDVIVLDISLPRLNGLDVCRDLTRKLRDAAVLILSMHDDEQMIATALEYGAVGYYLKESPAEQVLDAIHRVAAGEFCLGPGISRSVIDRIGKGEGDLYETLSSRERQVLQMIAEGKTNREIAQTLGLAIKTVDTHRTRLMRKLDIHNQTDLVKFVLRKGIVPLN